MQANDRANILGKLQQGLIGGGVSPGRRPGSPTPSPMAQILNKSSRARPMPARFSPAARKDSTISPTRCPPADTGKASHPTHPFPPKTSKHSKRSVVASARSAPRSISVLVYTTGCTALTRAKKSPKGQAAGPGQRNSGRLEPMPVWQSPVRRELSWAHSSLVLRAHSAANGALTRYTNG